MFLLCSFHKNTSQYTIELMREVSEYLVTIMCLFETWQEVSMILIISPLKCNANLYLSFRHAVIVHVALEQQYEQFTWVNIILVYYRATIV